MAFDEFKVETIDKYNERYIISQTQNLGYLNALNNADIDYEYNCSGFQSKIDELIIKLTQILDDNENEFIKWYKGCELQENKVQDVFYGMNRLKNFLEYKKKIL